MGSWQDNSPASDYRMRSLSVGIVKNIKPIGQKERSSIVRSMDGERIVFHLVSYHSLFHYDNDYGCKPRNTEDCDDCPYKFECFTTTKKRGFRDDGSDLIQIKFEGKTLSIFPSYWHQPEPTANELEAYLWGESNGRLQMRTSRGGGWR